MMFWSTWTMMRQIASMDRWNGCDVAVDLTTAQPLTRRHHASWRLNVDGSAEAGPWWEHLVDLVVETPDTTAVVALVVDSFRTGAPDRWVDRLIGRVHDLRRSDAWRGTRAVASYAWLVERSTERVVLVPIEAARL